jgi:hypothetical protein
MISVKKSQEIIKPVKEKLIKKSKKNKDPEILYKGQNIILHLKCKMSELYEYQKMLKKFENNELIYEPIVPNNNFIPYEEIIEHSYTSFINEINKTNKTNNVIENEKTLENVNDNIYLKLKDLKLQLYKNIPINKCSACFWCSYEYNTPLCYIPKHIINDMVYGYGSFCSPECSVAYLIKENLDDTTRYERYYLLNYLYGNGKCIKPSPNPYYTLDKYYGNLSIEEYRKLIKTNHLFVTIDKPMTRIFPEIHEENEEILMGGKESKLIKNNNNRIYKVKMQNDPVNDVIPQKGKVNPFPFLDKTVNKQSIN